MRKANFAFCVNNGLCKAKVGDNDPHPGCNCEEGFTGDHCEFLGNAIGGSHSGGSSSSSGSSTSSSGPSSGSSTGSSSGSSSGSSNNVIVSTPTSSGADEANRSVVVAISSILVLLLVGAGLFVLRTLVRGGGSANKGKTAAEAGAAVAEAEQEATAPGGFGDAASLGSGQQPFDETRQSLPQPSPARFDEGDGDLEDVEDYSNDQSDTSTLTEDDMSNVQIV